MNEEVKPVSVGEIVFRRDWFYPKNPALFEKPIKVVAVEDDIIRLENHAMQFNRDDLMSMEEAIAEIEKQKTTLDDRIYYLELWQLEGENLEQQTPGE